MLNRRRRFVPALIAGIALLAWLGPGTRTRAQAPAGPSPAAATPADKLFAKIYPVYAHPRCANCHGVVEHYPGFTHSVTPDTHPGGAVGAGMPDPVVDCTDCHDGPQHHNAAGVEEGAWKFTAPPNMEWAGLGEEEVCIMQAVEARLKNKAAGGESAATKGSYLHHLAEDPLIEQAFHGRAGGARDPADPDLPVPPLSYGDFKAGAKEWIDAGAPCRAMGSLSHYEKNDAVYEHPAPGGKIAVEQHARRQVDIIRHTDGTATATITASGSNVIVQTLETPECTIVTTSSSTWERIGPAQVSATLEFEVKPDNYKIRYVLPADTTREVQTGKQTNTCGIPPIVQEPDVVELTWNPWSVTLHCPTEFPNRDGSMGCVPTEPHDNGAADGALHQTVVGTSDIHARRSWLYGSPMPTGRTDTTESLPVHVKIIWALRMDQ